jgi:hypothetical protein
MPQIIYNVAYFHGRIGKSRKWYIGNMVLITLNTVSVSKQQSAVIYSHILPNIAMLPEKLKIHFDNKYYRYQNKTVEFLEENKMNLDARMD